MLALTRARATGARPPAAFAAAIERTRSLARLDVAERVESDVAPTCLDLDAAERRYLLVGTIDGGARVLDTERASSGASASVDVVCEIPGGGARASGGGRRERVDARTRSADAGHAYATSCARWLPSDTGGFFTASYDHVVKFWDANALVVASEVDVGSKCRTLALSERATARALVAVGSDDDGVKLWDPAANVIAHTLSGHRGGVSAIDWLRSSEYALATGGAEGDIRLWDIRRAGAYMIFDRHNTQPSARVDEIRDAMYAGSSVIGGTVEAGPRPASRRMADAVPEHLRADSARRCSSSGSGGGGSRKRARDGGWGGWGVGFRGRGGRFGGGGGSHSAERVVVARDGYSSVAASAHDGRVSCVKTTPCGMFLISTGLDGKIRRWDLENGLNTYAPFEDAGLALTATTCQVAITSDGERLFVPCADGRVRAYRTHKGALDAELRGHMDEVFSCAYKDGGDAELYTCGKDANVLLWRPAPASAENAHLDGDAWSEDEDETERRLVDPSSTHRSGLGYRSARRR